MKLVASFRIDPSSRPAYVEDLVGAIAHPLRCRIRRGALQSPAHRAALQLLQEPTDRSRDAALVRSPRRPHVTRIAVGVTPAFCAPRTLARRLQAGALARAPRTTRI